MIKKKYKIKHENKYTILTNVDCAVHNNEAIKKLYNEWWNVEVFLNL